MIGWWCSLWRIRDLVIIVDVLGLVEMDGGRAAGTQLLVWLLMLRDLIAGLFYCLDCDWMIGLVVLVIMIC